MKSLDLPLAAALLAGNLVYILAAFTSFNPLALARFEFTPFIIIVLTIIGGILAIVLGYLSIIFLGGKCSLGVGTFYAWVTRSKQVVEYDHQSKKGIYARILGNTYLIYATALVYLLVVAIAWDLHNADGPHAGVLYPFLNATNIFLRGPNVTPIRFSIDSLPLLILLTALAGLTPSLTLPYLRNFKITSVNSGAFPTSLLFLVIGLLAGLSAILTIVGFLYKVLWASAARAAPSYHFVLLVMLGFSIHYAAGSYLGRNRTEAMIIKSLERQPVTSRVFLGNVDVKPKNPSS